jgi:hypothetical protein
MAGGWEEVIAVGGGIRTGAGTGVKLDKQNEADRAAEGKILAAGPLLNKRTVFGWFLEKQWLWIFLESQCPKWGWPQQLAEKFM